MQYYKPKSGDNLHVIRVTFAYEEFVGHVEIPVHGNCKGADILDEGLSFWEVCEEDDMKHIISNDCKLRLHHNEAKDKYWYSMEMKHISGRDEYLIHDKLEDEELQDMIVKVEIISCEAD